MNTINVNMSILPPSVDSSIYRHQHENVLDTYTGCEYRKNNKNIYPRLPALPGLVYLIYLIYLICFFVLVMGLGSPSTTATPATS